MWIAKRTSIGLLTLGIAAPCAAGWIDRGPDLGGRLSAVVASPTNPNVLLVASPGGGVWRTNDGGANWHRPVNYAFGDFSVVHLEWDRVHSGRLYATTLSDLYASTDLGDHWSNLSHLGGYPAPPMPVSHPSDPKPFAQLRYSPTTGTVLWGRPCSGLYYSNDGTTFTQHWPFAGGSANEDNCLGAIAADDATGRVYFATLARGGTAHLFRSTCAWTATTPCLTWESANSGLPANAVVSAITYGGAANRLALAVAPSSSTLVYTTADGTHWAPTAAAPPSTSWDPRSLVSPGDNQLLLGSVVAYQSTDWGAHWSQVWFSGMHPDVRAFYWATYPSGGRLWLTTDGSAESGTYANLTRWSFTPGSAPTGGTTVGVHGIEAWQAYFVAATGSHGGARRRIFVGSVDNGALCSDDGGAHWTTAGAPPGNGCGDFASLVFAPSNPNRAYVRTCSSTAFARSDNAWSAPSCSAVTWTSLSPAGGHYTPALWTRAMSAVDPGNPNRVVFARLLEVAVSADGGSTWTNHALPGGAQPVSVYVENGGAILAGTMGSGAYRSTDNGATWAPFGLNSPAPKAVLNLAHSTAGGGVGTYFLATTSGLYRKLPSGTFTRQTADPAYTVSDVEVDPNCPTRVYAAMGYAGTLGQHRGGVLVSRDNGATFTSLTSGLDIHQAPITDIQVDPLDARFLHVAVYGMGAWTYDAGATPGCP
jgi:hypothetical protein